MLMRDLQEGTLDLIAENGAFDPMVYEARTYLNEEMLLAVPINLPVNEGLRDYCLTAAQIAAGTPLEQVRPVPLERFSGERFLLLKEGNDTRIRADRLCAQARFRPQVSLLLDQQLAAYNLAAYGLGVAFISDTLARRAQPDGRLLFYRLDGPAARRSVRFFYKRTRFLTSPMRAFLALLPPENASSANAM